MRLLLDTHALIWAAVDPGRLSSAATRAITDPANDVYVSAVSGWEIAIKRTKGLLRFPDLDRSMLDALRFSGLAIELRHMGCLAGLEQHHRDPFDRMLIAQALCDGLVLVSRDEVMGLYPVDVIW